MKDIGQRLKETREKKGVSVHDVSVAIKINAKTLQAIEDGDPSQLPAKPFLRGFVQTYSKYLDLNVDDIMKTFAEEVGTTKPKTQKANGPEGETSEPGSIETTDEAHKKIDLYKKIGFASAALIAIALVYFIQKTVGKYEKEQQIAETQKSALETTEEQALKDAAGTPANTVSGTAAPATAEEKAQEAKVEAPLVGNIAIPAPGPTAPQVIAPVPPASTAVPSAANLKPTNPPTPSNPTVALTPATPTTLPATALVPAKPLTPPVPVAAPKSAILTPPASPLTNPKPASVSTPTPAVTPPAAPAKSGVALVGLPAASPNAVKPADSKTTEIKPVVAKPVATPPVAAPAVAIVPPVEKKTEDDSKKVPQQIIIEALDNVEIRFTKDGEGEKTVRLKPEQVLTIRADYKVNLNINDGGAVNLIRNGKEIGVPGNLGKSTKLNYP